METQRPLTPAEQENITTLLTWMEAIKFCPKCHHMHYPPLERDNQNKITCQGCGYHWRPRSTTKGA